MLDAAGVNDDRTRDHGNAAAGDFDLAHHLRDTGDAAFDPPLRGHVVAHEREPEAIPFAELRSHAYAVVTADDAFAGLQVAQLAAGGRLSRDEDHRVHALAIEVAPVDVWVKVG